MISEKYPSMPFSIASLEDSTAARVGVAECVNHDLLHMYPILTEKVGEFVAQFKATVALLPSGSLILTGLPFESTLYESGLKIENKEILDLLATSLDRKQIKKEKKAAAKKDEKKEEPKKEEPKKEEAKPAAVAEVKKEVKA